MIRSAKAFGGDDGAQADRSVANHCYDVAGFDLCAHRGVLAGPHDVGQGQE
jgi:hypothetical protein